MLRKIVPLVLLILLSGELTSAAHAQKDPFQPLVREGEPAPAAATTGAAATPVTAGGAARTLPQTGFDFVSPAVIAFLLLLAGLVFLALARYTEAPVRPASS